MAKTMKILAVDDDAAVLETLVELLKKYWGHTVRTATNGREAIALIANGSSVFDLVITDRDMPAGGVPGEEVIKAAKQKGLKAVLMSGHVVDGRTIATAASADRFLPKPFDIKELKRIIAELFPKQV